MQNLFFSLQTKLELVYKILHIFWVQFFPNKTVFGLEKDTELIVAAPKGVQGYIKSIIEEYLFL